MKEIINNEKAQTGSIIVGLIIVLFVIGGIYMFSGYHQVKPGYEGVLYSWDGGIIPEPLTPGLKWVDPLRVSLKSEISVQNQVYNTVTDAGTADLQSIHSTISLNWRIKTGHTPYVYQNIANGDVLGVLITPEFPSKYKSVTSDYKVTELLPNRAKIEGRTRDLLNAKFADSFVEVLNVNVIDFGLDPKYQESIVRKQVEETNIQTELNILEQRKAQREQAIVTAEGAAQAMKIQATALKENINLIEWERLQVQKLWVQKWSGVQPQFMVGSDGQTPEFIIPIPAPK